jgi:hypothetical protein
MNPRTLLIGILTLAGLHPTGHADQFHSVGSLIIESIDFHETPVSDALDYLQAKSAAIDPGKHGFNLVLGADVPRDTPVTLKLLNVPLAAALGYITELAGLDLRVDAHAVRVLPRQPETPPAAPLSNGNTVNRTRHMEIPYVDFNDADLASVAEFLTQKTTEVAPDKRGFNFILGPGVDPGQSVSLRLNQVPLANILGFISEITELRIRADEHAIVFTNPTPNPPDSGQSLPENATTPNLPRRPTPNAAAKVRTALQPAALGTATSDPRSPAHPDYVKSTHPNVPTRSNALGNAYRWVNGAWTYTGPKYKKVGGQWRPVENQSTTLQPASGLNAK